MNQKFTLNVNGTSHDLEADPDMPLLYALRDHLGLNNPHFGCGLAQCGACTVHLNGQPIRSCATTISSVGDARIFDALRTGHDGKAASIANRLYRGTGAAMRLLRERLDHDAAAFLKEKKHPTGLRSRTRCKASLKCRCGTHVSILKAVKRAADMMG